MNGYNPAVAALEPYRTPVPRFLHVCSIAFLLTVGLLCAALILSAPARYFQDPSLVPDHLGGWLWWAGIGVFPLLHWLGVYRRSVAASLLVIPFHATLLYILIMAAGMVISEYGIFSAFLVFVVLAGIQTVLIGAMLWWARHLWRVRAGRATPAIAPAPCREAESKHVPLGTRGWMLERSDLAIEMRRASEAIRRRAPWFSPIWSVLYWPLCIVVWSGLVVASIGVPGFAVNFAALVAGGPEGVLFWLLVGVIFAALAFLLFCSIRMFVRKFGQRIFDAQGLVSVLLLLLGAAAVVVLLQHHPEWSGNAPQHPAAEATESAVEP